MGHPFWPPWGTPSGTPSLASCFRSWAGHGGFGQSGTRTSGLFYSRAQKSGERSDCEKRRAGRVEEPGGAWTPFIPSTERAAETEVRGWGEQKRNQKQRMRPAQPSAFCRVLIKPIVPFRVEHMFRAWLRFGTEISMVLGPVACRGGEPGGEELRGTIPKPYKNR